MGRLLQFWVYLLRCSDGRYYAGHTDDLERRIAQHQQGSGSDFTARRRPVSLVWSAVVPSREEALAFELRIKGWTRSKKEALIAGDWARIHDLAHGPEARASTSLSTSDALAYGDPAGGHDTFVRSEVEGRSAPSESA